MSELKYNNKVNTGIKRKYILSEVFKDEKFIFKTVRLYNMKIQLNVMVF